MLLRCHCEPFASCHCEVAEGNRSNLRWAQGKLREAIANGLNGLRSLFRSAQGGEESRSGFASASPRNRSAPRNDTPFITFVLIQIESFCLCHWLLLLSIFNHPKIEK